MRSTRTGTSTQPRSTSRASGSPTLIRGSRNPQRVVTTAAAEIVGLPEMGRVAPGAPAHLVVFPARSFSEFLSRPGSDRRLVDGETIRDARPPGYGELR